jgi:hypothetical protein
VVSFNLLLLMGGYISYNDNFRWLFDTLSKSINNNRLDSSNTKVIVWVVIVILQKNSNNDSTIQGNNSPLSKRTL